MQVADTIYDTLRRGYYSGCSIVEYLRRRLIFYNKHRTDDCSAFLSPIEQFRTLQQGFYPTSRILYGHNSTSELYLDDWTRESVKDNINEDYECVTRNKLLFQQLMEERFGGVLPTVYGVVTTAGVTSTTGEHITNNVTSWVANIVQNHGIVICKPIWESGGTGVRVIQRREDQAVTVNGNHVPTDQVLESLTDRPFLITEYISQHPYANIYPDSINTIRILAFQHPTTQEWFIPQAIHRFGTDQSAPTDNWNKGGLSASIDLETGRIGAATRPPKSSSPDWYSNHPNTGKTIKGVEIPKWDNILSKTLEMSSLFQYYDLLAWDIVITSQGIVVIECNEWPTVSMMQVHQPLLIDERVREFYKEHGAELS